MKNILTILISTIILGVLFFGCKSDKSPTGPSPMTVNGVVNDYWGNPIANAIILMPGKSPVNTNARGEFSFGNITPPYDLSVVLSTSKAALVYKGLNRSDPKLLYLESVASTSYTATINGYVPPATDRTSRVIFVSGGRYWSRTADPTSGAYARTISWSGMSDSLVGKLYFLRWVTSPSGITDIYDAYAVKDITIKNGNTYNNQNFANADLINPPDKNISGTILKPSDYDLSSRSVYLKLIDASIYLSGETSTLPAFSFNVPEILNSSISVSAYAQKGTYPSALSANFKKTGIEAGATGISVQIESAPLPLLPLNNTTNVDTTTGFTCSPASGGGINLFILYPASSSYPPVHPTFYIFTSGNNIQIPNFSTYGLGLPSNTNYSWYIINFYPVPSIDDVASNTFRKLWIGEDIKDFGNGTSPTLNFTTKP